MALTNIDSALSDTIRFLKSISAGGGIELMSYKRNRTIAVIVLENGNYLVRERGYLENDEEIPADLLQKHLKKRMKHEFPRSRKIRLFKFRKASELDRIHQKI